MEIKSFAECSNIIDHLVLSNSGKDGGVCLEYLESFHKYFVCKGVKLYYLYFHK